MSIDAVIVGGGPAGCCLAALLARGGIDVAVIDKEDPAATLAATFDGRTTALSLGSRRILEGAGLWDRIEAATCPIETILITEEGAPPLTVFESRAAGEPAFGWIAENAHVRAGLYDHLKRAGVRHIAPAAVAGFAVEGGGAVVTLADGRTVRGALAVGADGRNSFMRRTAGIEARAREYGQTATVCVVGHQRPHGNAAVEDFRREGPFAILPMPDDAEGRHRSSIVWTDHGGKDTPAAWDAAVFDAALAERFPASYGAVRAAGPRFSYPLSLTHAERYTADRLALVADAAHAIHPIAGQGLNLGLRDAALLASLVIDAKARNADIGAAALLADYERTRRADVATMIGATDLLNRIFSNDLKTLGIARRRGLALVERFPPAKRFFMRHAMGLSRFARAASRS